MDRFIEADEKNVESVILKYNVLCCKLRNSRIKSKQLGIMEMLMLNYDLNVLFIKNGPLGDVKGLVSFAVDKNSWDKVISRLNCLGYFNKFYTLDFKNDKAENNSDIETINPLNWKGLKYSLNTVFIQDEKLYEEQSPHNRIFKIMSHNGEEREIRGYRGNGTDLGRRALPVEDARCLVNLSMPYVENRVLEPFAGGGGIVFMYKYINPDIDITSIDIDEALKPGLEYYGAKHIVGNSATVHLTESYDAIVTEVPFSGNATEQVICSFKNFYNNLTQMGIIVLMCGIDQNHEIFECFKNDLDSNLLFSKNLNRKGTDVVIQVWTKNFDLKKEFKNTVETISKTF